MLNANRLALVLWVSLAVLVPCACCGGYVELPDAGEEVLQELPLRMHVKNSTSDRITLVGEEPFAERVIGPGEGADVDFLARRVRLTYTTGDVFERQVIAAPPGPRWIFASGADYELRIRLGRSETMSFLIRVCPSWFESGGVPSGLAVDVAGTPEEGIPANRCGD